MLWFSILAWKNFWLRLLNILRKTDKLNFTNSNLMCVYTYFKFEKINIKLSLCIFQTFEWKHFSFDSCMSKLYLDEWCTTSSMFKKKKYYTFIHTVSRMSRCQAIGSFTILTLNTIFTSKLMSKGSNWALFTRLWSFNRIKCSWFT